MVAGASRGIGAAVARRCAADGYEVIACARSNGALQRLAAETPRITPVVADVSNPDDVDRVAATARSAGTLHAWINCAAVVDKATFTDLDPERWRRQMAVNLDGVYLCCRAAFTTMRDTGGVIVNIASLSGVAGVEKFAGLSAYNVAKAGVIALSEAIALEGRQYGIRCVCVSPGAVDTEMLRQAAPHLRAAMSADEFASIVAFLLSEVAAPLSGTNIPIFSNAEAPAAQA